jgi:uncharacterized repeat protein (TIGR04138 family)
MARTSDEQPVTLAGWTTTIPRGMLLFYLHPIPRPYSYLTQLKIDARSYKPWLFWIGGGGLTAHRFYSLDGQPGAGVLGGVSSRQAWINIEFGVALLLFWLRCFFQAVHCTRTAPLEVGLIRTLKFLPPWPDLSSAEAIQADGTVVEVTVSRAIVDGLLEDHGECEVLFYKRPRRWRAKSDTGFAFAARVPLEGREAPERADHWTSLPAGQRLKLQQIARQAGYPVDAVFFVLSALSAVEQRQHDAGKESRPGDGQGDARNAPTRELCRFVPEHAVWMFRGRASKVLAAWGLRTGDDIGAIVTACVEAGWLKFKSGESADDFRGIDILSALREKRPESK